MLLLAFVFFRSERKELQAIIPQLRQANNFWLLMAAIVTALYIFFQGGIYRKSFSSVNLQLPWIHAIILFLKRNFVGTFLPAGSVSSLAYSPSQVRRHGFNQSDVYQASALFGFAGLLTVFIAGVPVVVYTIISTSKFKESWIGLVVIFAIIATLFWLFKTIKSGGFLFSVIEKYLPSKALLLRKLVSADVDGWKFGQAVTFSVGVEITGMLHVFLAMLAIGAPASFGAAAAAYIIAVLMMVISPFLRGLGAVEISMVYVLTEFGYSPSEALSITILFRVFEFWLPLFCSLFSFGWQGKKLFLRVAPVLLIFSLGVINVVSALTPPLQQRMRFLRRYLPLDAIHASNVLVLFLGLALLITSAYLIRGFRNAWRIAMVVTVLSLIGNITKALDYEEALFCFVTIIFLYSTSGQYKVMSSPRKLRNGLLTSLSVFIAVLTFGFVSFYFVDPKHFGVDFTWEQSLIHTLRSFLLIEDDTIIPATHFGEEYIHIVRGLGFFTWMFLLFSLIRTDKTKMKTSDSQIEKAKFLLKQYGNSAVDYFKVYKDKLIFISAVFEGFIGYKVSGNFAIVLSDPVCPEEDKLNVLREFESHCYQMGLRPAFYRVDEGSLHLYESLKKKILMIGQEAILDVKIFSLEGKDKKSLRNGLNGLQKNGFRAEIHKAPHDKGFIGKLRAVSDEWLLDFDKNESVFSQGMFDEDEIREQDVITIAGPDEKIMAFLNIVPDYAEDECTYDLIRRTTDAPAAAMDALIVKLVEYAAENQKSFVNMGLVPMTGLPKSNQAAEQIMKVVAEKWKRFHHYKGLRFFKEKYASVWENKYLIYDNDLDLIQLPVALNNVMKA